MVRKNSEIYGAQITGKMHLQVNKLKIDIFTHGPPGKTLPKIIIITSQANGNYSFPQVELFRKSIPPKERVRGGGLSLSSFFPRLLIFFEIGPVRQKSCMK